MRDWRRSRKINAKIPTVLIISSWRISSRENSSNSRISTISFIVGGVSIGWLAGGEIWGSTLEIGEKEVHDVQLFEDVDDCGVSLHEDGEELEAEKGDWVLVFQDGEEIGEELLGD